MPAAPVEVAREPDAAKAPRATRAMLSKKKLDIAALRKAHAGTRDAAAGRPLELEALVGAVREIGAAVGVPSPATDALHGLARLHAQVAGLPPG